MYKTQLLKINNIAGMHYTHDILSSTLIVYGIGAPVPPDNGMLSDSKIINKFDCDIFVPDYIGYGRSDGVFTPINCIKTFLSLYGLFIDGCYGKNYYSHLRIKLKYKRIIFIGKSLGGTYVPLLPRFNKNISEMAIFCPVVDSKSCGSIKGEETNKDFLGSMKNDGYYHLYRGVLDKVWEKHLENKDDLSPMDNITYLFKSKLFIAHGKKDICVNYTKSVVYYNKIAKQYPDRPNQFKLNLYPKGDHGISTTNNAVKDFLQWLKIPVYN